MPPEMCLIGDLEDVIAIHPEQCLVRAGIQRSPFFGIITLIFLTALRRIEGMTIRRSPSVKANADKIVLPIDDDAGYWSPLPVYGHLPKLQGSRLAEVEYRVLSPAVPGMLRIRFCVVVHYVTAVIYPLERTLREAAALAVPAFHRLAFEICPGGWRGLVIPLVPEQRIRRFDRGLSEYRRALSKKSKKGGRQQPLHVDIP